MKPRVCWSVLQGKAEQKITKIQADMVQARQLMSTLTASRERLKFLYEEYRAQEIASLQTSHGMQDAMNHRQFMGQLQNLSERVEQDIVKAQLALEGLRLPMAQAENERLKMKSLDEQEHLAYQARNRKREQTRMDEMGVMQFNRLSHT